MSDTNYFCVLGHLAQDAKIFTTKTGIKRVFFSIANNRFFKNKDNETVVTVTYLPITLWGEYAEKCFPYLIKGACVSAEGRLVNDVWKDAEGKTHSRLSMVTSKGGLNIIGPKMNKTMPSSNNSLSQKDLENLAAVASVDSPDEPEDYSSEDYQSAPEDFDFNDAE